MAYKKEKETAEKLKMTELEAQFQKSIADKPIDEIKKLDLPEDTLRQVEEMLENEAKAKVSEIQGAYYETYD